MFIRARIAVAWRGSASGRDRTLTTLCDMGDRPKALASLQREARRVVHKAHAKRAALRLARDVARIVGRSGAVHS